MVMIHWSIVLNGNNIRISMKNVLHACFFVLQFVIVVVV